MQRRREGGAGGRRSRPFLHRGGRYRVPRNAAARGRPPPACAGGGRGKRGAGAQRVPRTARGGACLSLPRAVVGENLPVVGLARADGQGQELRLCCWRPGGRPGCRPGARPWKGPAHGAGGGGSSPERPARRASCPGRRADPPAGRTPPCMLRGCLPPLWTRCRLPAVGL